VRPGARMKRRIERARLFLRSLDHAPEECSRIEPRECRRGARDW
jgi:hypothetical protein